jgi:hypothetical protein
MYAALSDQRIQRDQPFSGSVAHPFHRVAPVSNRLTQWGGLERLESLQTTFRVVENVIVLKPEPLVLPQNLYTIGL